MVIGDGDEMRGVRGGLRDEAGKFDYDEGKVRRIWDRVKDG